MGAGLRTVETESGVSPRNATPHDLPGSRKKGSGSWRACRNRHRHDQRRPGGGAPKNGARPELTIGRDTQVQREPSQPVAHRSPRHQETAPRVCGLVAHTQGAAHRTKRPHPGCAVSSRTPWVRFIGSRDHRAQIRRAARRGGLRGRARFIGSRDHRAQIRRAVRRGGLRGNSGAPLGVTRRVERPPNSTARRVLGQPAARVTPAGVTRRVTPSSGSAHPSRSP